MLFRIDYLDSFGTKFVGLDLIASSRIKAIDKFYSDCIGCDMLKIKVC